MNAIKKCKVCLIHDADKKNSHIVPKFLGKRLFENEKRHSLTISAHANVRKVQDISKEDYLFCSYCEKRFEILETIVSAELAKINDFREHPEHFKINTIDQKIFLECQQLDTNIFLLFLYSIIFRMSVSSLTEFSQIDLSKDNDNIEEDIRKVLNHYMSDKKANLIASLNEFESLDYTLCVNYPIVRNEHTRGIITAYKLEENFYHLFLGEFLLVFYPPKSKVAFAHEYFKIKQNNKIIIPLADVDSWRKLIFLVCSKLPN